MYVQAQSTSSPRLAPGTPLAQLAAREAPGPAAPNPLKPRPAPFLAALRTAVYNLPGLRALRVRYYGWATRPKPGQPPLSNLGTLSPSLRRGAQPSDAGLATLAAQGVKTVINLREERDQERATVEALGLRYVYLPLPSAGQPTVAQGLAFLQAATDPANGEVFFHCYHGADRTGAMAAIYRIAAMGWSADKAIAEMPHYAYHGGFESDKEDFVRVFATRWAALSPAEQARTLHREPVSR